MPNGPWSVPLPSLSQHPGGNQKSGAWTAGVRIPADFVKFFTKSVGWRPFRGI